MKKLILIGICTVLLAGIQCKEDTNRDFLISKDRVGKISRADKFSELDSIFKQDSIVMASLATNVGGTPGRAKVYEKGGNHLLTITAGTDSVKGIENIRILDPRFTTAEGIGLGSTFKEVTDKYAVRKVVTSLNNVVIFLKGQDFYFTLSRDELPANLRYNRGISIEEVQIPDNARFKYLMVGWD